MTPPIGRKFYGSRETSTFLWLDLVFAAAANLFTLGLVLLLSGLRELSLLTSTRARRGALARLGAINVALPLLFVDTIAGSNALADVAQSEWFQLSIMIGALTVAGASMRRFRSGWQHEARTAEQALAADPRAPVVYLRSFVVDEQLWMTGGWVARVVRFLIYTLSTSPEQEMSFVMEQVGPVITIGRPGEPLPGLGAARLYVRDDEWREVVGQKMTDAALVVIRAGDTPNLWWEIKHAMSRCPRGRILMMALGPPAAQTTFDRRFVEEFGAPPMCAPPKPRSRMLGIISRLLIPPGARFGKIIYFDRNGTPNEQPISFQLSWPGVVLLAYRPYRDSLRAASGWSLGSSGFHG